MASLAHSLLPPRLDRTGRALAGASLTPQRATRPAAPPEPTPRCRQTELAVGGQHGRVRSCWAAAQPALQASSAGPLLSAPTWRSRRCTPGLPPAGRRFGPGRAASAGHPPLAGWQLHEQAATGGAASSERMQFNSEVGTAAAHVRLWVRLQLMAAPSPSSLYSLITVSPAPLRGVSCGMGHQARRGCSARVGAAPPAFRRTRPASETRAVAQEHAGLAPPTQPTMEVCGHCASPGRDPARPSSTAQGMPRALPGAAGQNAACCGIQALPQKHVQRASRLPRKP